jgi:hypothetical protein
MLKGPEGSGLATGDAIGFADGCVPTRGAAGLSATVLVVSISTALVRGMLMKSTYNTTNAMTKDRHSAAPIVSDESLRDPCR